MMDLALQIEIQKETKKISGLKKWLMRTFRKKLYLRHKQLEGWKGELPFYIFWCDACEQFAIDYPHGFIKRRNLICPHCLLYYSFVPLEVKISLFYHIIKSIFHLWRQTRKINKMAR